MVRHFGFDLDFYGTSRYDCSMSNYYNEAGEPLMDGAAMRYEMYLDSTYEPDPDEFYNSWEDDECDLSYDLDLFDGRTWCYTHDQYGDLCEEDESDYEGGEDAWLDSYMEDRLSTMFE